MKGRPVFACLAVAAALAAGGCSGPAPGSVVRVRQANQPEMRMHSTAKMRYLVNLPEGYGRGGGRWPLLLFLHGSGEAGDDLERVKIHGPPRIAPARPGFAFIVVSPQAPSGSRWNADALAELLDHIAATYAVDEDRVYVTGLSMGGHGTWSLATEYPERFAAIAPICGGGDTARACRLKGVPVWAFHGARDDVVDPRASADMVAAVQACGGEARLSLDPEAGHDAWTRAYDDPELYRWLLSHRRKRPR